MQTWYVIYKNTSRGFNKSNGTYTVVHFADAADDLCGPSIDGAIRVGQAYQAPPVGPKYWVWRGGLVLPTSCLPDAMSISAAYLLFKYFPVLWSTLVLVNGSGLVEPLVLADYDDLSHEMASLGSVGISDYSDVFKSLPINPTGILDIDKTGLTYYGLRSQKDIGGVNPHVPPGGSVGYYVTISARDYDEFTFGKVTISNISPISARFDAEITDIGTGGDMPVVLKVEGDGVGEFSNIDTRLYYSYEPALEWGTCVLSHDGSIFAGFDSTPAQVVKLDPATMEAIRVWRGAAGQNRAMCLSTDGTYIYVGLLTAPAQVIKIDPTTMATVATWTGETDWDDCMSLTYVAGFLFAILGTDPLRIIRIDTSTMTTDDSVEGDEAYGYAITNDGTYLYFVHGRNPAQVWQFEPLTLTDVDHWEMAADGQVNALVCEGGYIYAGGLMLEAPLTRAFVIQIDTSDMSEGLTWLGADGENLCRALATDGTYIYAGLAIDPSMVIKIEIATMTTDDSWTGAVGQNDSYGIAYDGTYIYAAFYIIGPAQAVQVSPVTMITEDTWEAQNDVSLDWQENHPFYKRWGENVTGLVPGTTYDVGVQWRFHGEVDVYDCAEESFLTPYDPIYGSAGLPILALL